MGLAWTEDENLLEWQRLDEPIFTYQNGMDWEKAGLYKCCVIEYQEKYWMFYNAKRDNQWPWIEETGLAFSNDLIHWERYEENPVLEVKEGSFFSQFFSDPCIKHDGFQWVNFAFGFDGNHAQVALAVSDDLTVWRCGQQPLIPHGQQGELDEIHAHKSSVIYWNGVLYHFYCACRNYKPGDLTKLKVFEGQYEFRSIAVSTSKPIANEEQNYS
jgi:sucrose-6-phosphate hydrolase SacC (GH32 family)